MAIIEVSESLENIGIYSRKKTIGAELDMVNNFIEYRKATFKEKADKNLAIFVEPKINNSYPDILFAEFNPLIYEKWEKPRNDLSVFDLKILNYIFSYKRANSSDMVAILSVNYKKLLFSLEKLFDSKLIDRINGNWEIYNKDFIGIKKIEAIEAKISKWNEVMQQALVNKNFANESCVLSKLQGEPKEHIIDQLSKFGIGIYLFNDVNFSKVIKARKNKFPINHNSLYVNEWIGRMLNN